MAMRAESSTTRTPISFLADKNLASLLLHEGGGAWNCAWGCGNFSEVWDVLGSVDDLGLANCPLGSGNVTSFAGRPMSIAPEGNPLNPTINANRLLAALAPRDKGLIQPYLVPRIVGRMEVLFEPGDDVNTTYFPCRGTMGSLLIVSKEGREVEAASIGREGAIGGIVSAGHKPAFGRAVVQIGGPVFSIDTGRLEDAKSRSARSMISSRAMPTRCLPR